MDASSSRNDGPPVVAYHLWPGRNRFCCDGQLMTGPAEDWPSNCCAWSSILVISTCYFIFAAPWLWSHVSPALPILAALLLIITCGFFLTTSFSDPGIIPRRSWTKLIRFEDENEHKEDVKDENDEALSKICETCQVVRPPRASHCSICDNCVEVFDHHCPFVNNCIGKRNYPFFLGFLLSVTLLAIIVMTGFVLLMRRDQGEDSMSTTMLIVMGIFLGLPTLCLSIALISFGAWHLYLICTGVTTRERLKGLNNQHISEGGCPCNLFNTWRSRGESMLGLTQRISRARLTNQAAHSPSLSASQHPTFVI